MLSTALRRLALGTSPGTLLRGARVLRAALQNSASAPTPGPARMLSGYSSNPVALNPATPLSQNRYVRMGVGTVAAAASVTALALAAQDDGWLSTKTAYCDAGSLATTLTTVSNELSGMLTALGDLENLDRVISEMQDKDPEAIASNFKPLLDLLNNSNRVIQLCINPLGTLKSEIEQYLITLAVDKFVDFSQMKKMYDKLNQLQLDFIRLDQKIASAQSRLNGGHARIKRGLAAFKSDLAEMISTSDDAVEKFNIRKKRVADLKKAIGMSSERIRELQGCKQEMRVRMNTYDAANKAKAENLIEVATNKITRCKADIRGGQHEMDGHVSDMKLLHSYINHTHKAKLQLVNKIASLKQADKKMMALENELVKLKASRQPLKKTIDDVYAELTKRLAAKKPASPRPKR